MKPSIRLAVALAASIGVVPARAALGQAPCEVAQVVVDSARNEVLSVLESGGQIVKEIRDEQGLKELPKITLVRDPAVCTRAATGFGHSVSKGDSFVVLQVGPLLYAREPYQRRGTGILLDANYKVVARFGVPIK